VLGLEGRRSISMIDSLWKIERSPQVQVGHPWIASTSVFHQCPVAGGHYLPRSN
jgi:hypothetical protein